MVAWGINPRPKDGSKGNRMLTKRNRAARIARMNRVDFQVVENETPVSENVAEVNEAEESNTSNHVRDTDFGEILRGTFSINVKSDEIDKETKEKKVLYSNDAEAFEYEKVSSFSNMLLHAGAKLGEDQVKFLVEALSSDDEETSKSIGKAMLQIQSLYNAKLKADAKSSAYAALVNKYKPLEGEKKESAQSQLVARFVKLAGVSQDAAIEALKKAGALPETFTTADLVPLRKTKGDVEDDD